MKKLRNEEKRLIKRAPNIAVPKFSILTSLISSPTKYKINALITNMNNPRESIVTGNVNVISIGRRMALRSPNANPAKIAVEKSSMKIPGRDQATA
jgi:hypothetical protein